MTSNATEVSDVIFSPPPYEILSLFEFQESIAESMRHIGAEDFIATHGSHELGIPRIEIPIFTIPDKLIPLRFAMKIQNIVLTLKIKDLGIGKQEADDQEFAESLLNLPYVSRAWRYMGAQYNPVRFDSVIMRKRIYDAAALYFSSGKLVLTGCYRPELALDQARREMRNIISIINQPSVVCDPTLQNIVSSGEFPYKICANYMAVMYPTICSKVGKFPGTMIKDPERFGDRVILVFRSGRLCHSGARNPMQIYEDIKNVCPILVECISTPKREELDAVCLRMLRKVMSPDQYKRRTNTLRTAIQNNTVKTTSAKKKKRPNDPETPNTPRKRPKTTDS